MAEMIYAIDKEELDKFTHDMTENLGIVRSCIEGCKSDKTFHTPELKKIYLENAHASIVKSIELLDNFKK